METEFIELDFHVPSHLTVTWVLSWKSSLLDSISVNSPQHSTCCHGSQLGTDFPLCPSHYISVHLILLSLHSFQYTQSSEIPLHYTHLTQHLRYAILYSLVFFVKKNLEHIRKSYALFIYFFLLV